MRAVLQLLLVRATVAVRVVGRARPRCRRTDRGRTASRTRWADRRHRRHRSARASAADVGRGRVVGRHRVEHAGGHRRGVGDLLPRRRGREPGDDLDGRGRPGRQLGERHGAVVARSRADAREVAVHDTYSRPTGRLSVTTTPDAGSVLGVDDLQRERDVLARQEHTDVGRLGDRQVHREAELLDHGVAVAAAVGGLERVDTTEAVDVDRVALRVDRHIVGRAAEVGLARGVDGHGVERLAVGVGPEIAREDERRARRR